MLQPRRLRRAAMLAVGASLAFTSTAYAIDEVNTQRLRDGVTINGMLAHERAFQFIANANGGTRASGTPGYDASADYVQERLRSAGYRTVVQEFMFRYYEETAPAVLAQVTPNAKNYATGSYQYSGSGDVTAPVQPVDVVIPPTPAPSSTSGCEASDFASFTAGNIALIQRGTCTFGAKAENAEAAGASAVIIFNEGQPGRTDLSPGTLGEDAEVDIPVVAASFADGEELYNLAQAPAGVTARVATAILDEQRPTSNVLAYSREGNTEEKVVVGAHLDSVLEGPGINDNGSGSAGILEIAEELDETGLDGRLRRQLVFAFWGAEESGLVGSEYYVGQLSPTQLGRHYANLNFDMIGSPNYVRFIYDGDNSAFEPDGVNVFAGPPGSGEIESIFENYFAGQGLASDPTPFSGRSDYGPFIAAGIPAGGLFTGAEGIKTPEQAAIYGGTAGIAYDPNYHQVGDDITNVSTKALGEMADAAAHTTYTLGRSRSGIFEDGSRVMSNKVERMHAEAAR
jgi:Zn-dependent M28 family amino/carboxypeptidase